MTEAQQNGKWAHRNSGYAWAVVSMLTFAYTVSYIDRQVLNLMIDAIKTDLDAIDTQMSLLQGAAFIIAYLTFTPIFGRMADTGSRKKIITMAVIVWSGFTVLCGFSTNLPLLFFARAGVGAAEAALAPAAFSLITDYFTKERLPRALSIFSIGPYLGGGFALIAGGLLFWTAERLAESLPFLSGLMAWQITFIVVGAAGIPLSLVLFLMLREPPRRVIASTAIDERHFSLVETWSFLWQRRSFYFRFYIAMACTVVVFYTIPAWMPVLLIRKYGADPGSVGLVYGALVLVVGTLGVLSGPILEEWLRKRGHKGSVVICIILAGVGLAITSVMLFFARSYESTLIIAGLAAFLYSFPQPIAATALQIVTPNRMRGVVFSVYVLTVSGIGLGIAPTLVALITDYVFKDDLQVNYSLAIICTVSATLAAWLGYGALDPYRKAVEAEEEIAAKLEERSLSETTDPIGRVEQMSPSKA